MCTISIVNGGFELMAVVNAEGQQAHMKRNAAERLFPTPLPVTSLQLAVKFKSRMLRGLK